MSLQERDIVSWETNIATFVVAIVVITLPLILYLEYAPGSQNFLVKLGFNYGLAPSVAILIFCSARYDSYLSQFLSTKLMVMLGEASYSIYLIHMLIYLHFMAPTEPLPATNLVIAAVSVRLVFMLALIILL